MVDPQILRLAIITLVEEKKLTRLVNRELQNFGFLAITRRILVRIRQTFVEALDIL
jgi:hypothetical protein